MRKAAIARRVVHGLQRLVPRARNGVTVLAYHLVDGGTDSPVDLSLETFTSHLDWLVRHARVVDLDDVDPEGPADQVVLTFDDAYANFHDVIWPLLRARELPATLYVPIDYVDGEGACPIRGTDLPACTWDQLQAMADAGLSIGSHTFAHPDLRSVEGEALRREIVDSRAFLEERLGHPCPSFCYPRGLVTDGAAAVVTVAYRYGTVGGGRKLRGKTPPALVPRISLRREHGVDVLARMVQQRVWIEEFAADRVRQLLA
jgi:peptidoglycan/xylan/chitin deacetylase (PgdA/CDA1 family)